VSIGIPVEVAEFIGFYVYALRDPETNVSSNVGKGQVAEYFTFRELAPVLLTNGRS